MSKVAFFVTFLKNYAQREREEQVRMDIGKRSGIRIKIINEESISGGMAIGLKRPACRKGIRGAVVERVNTEKK